MVKQRAKTVVFDNLGLVDFAIRLVIFVRNLPDRQVLFFGEIQITEGLSSILLIKKGLGLVEMTWGLVHSSYSLPKWQAVKLTCFAPCQITCDHITGDRRPKFAWSDCVLCIPVILRGPLREGTYFSNLNFKYDHFTLCGVGYVLVSI